MPDPLSTEAFRQAYEFAQNQNQADKALHVRFYYDEIKDDVASEAEGRPIFKSVEMCEIRYGDKDNIVQDRVKYMHPDPRKRFPEQYARFKAGEATQVVGTLLRQWGLIDAATAKSYEAIGIMTVEQLSEVADGLTKQVRGMVGDRQKAKDFLAMAAGQAPLAQARAEIDALKARLAALEERAPEDVESGVKFTKAGTVRRKPGPKPKADAAEAPQE